MPRGIEWVGHGQQSGEVTSRAWWKSKAFGLVVYAVLLASICGYFVQKHWHWKEKRDTADAAAFVNAEANFRKWTYEEVVDGAVVVWRGDQASIIYVAHELGGSFDYLNEGWVVWARSQAGRLFVVEFYLDPDNDFAMRLERPHPLLKTEGDLVKTLQGHGETKLLEQLGVKRQPA